MNKFIYKTVLFISIILSILSLSLIYLPNPSIKGSMLEAIEDKHNLLKETKSPRIILLGGSNVSFGVNSQRIVDSLQMRPVNISIHAGLGLKFMIDDIKPFIRKGDILILIPEYSQFYTNIFYGSSELVAMLFEIERAAKKDISIKQWYQLLNYIPAYAASKIRYFQNIEKKTVGIYDRKSFNKYGDAYIHWDLPRSKVTTANKSTAEDKVNQTVLNYIENLRGYLDKKQATLVILPPAYQASSYLNQKEIITQITNELRQNGTPYLSSPEKYKFDDSLFFNTNYHLTKQGVEIRTTKLISDIQSVVFNR